MLRNLYKDIYDNDGHHFFRMKYSGEMDIFLVTDYGGRAYIDAIYSNICQCYVGISDNIDEIEYFTSNHRNFTINQYARSIEKLFNIHVTPMYHEPTQFERDFTQYEQQTEFSLMQICMDNIPEIDESLLKWEQINEIRHDRNEIEKLRRFRLWSFTELSGKSKEEIRCEFEKELDDYKFALKKHGIMTSMGGITTVLSASATVLDGINNGLLSGIAAGVTVTSAIIYFTAQQIAEYFETSRKPIAYVYDIAKKLKKK